MSLKLTDISEERSVSVLRTEEQTKQPASTSVLKVDDILSSETKETVYLTTDVTS
jgi:hypothetical protein